MPTPLFKNLSLERLSEVFGYIKAELDKKVTVVNGKGLSTNDYTNTEKNKLSGIASGAEVNVQSDWNESSSSSDAYILNKPTKLSQFTDDVVSGHYLPLTGGSLTGNLNVSGSSDTSLYTHGDASGSYIGFRNQSGNTTFGYIGVKNDNLPYFYSNGSKRIALLSEIPTKVSQLTNDSGYTTNIGTVTQVKVGSTAYNPSSGVVSLPAYPTVPTKTSQLTNDSGFLTSHQTLYESNLNWGGRNFSGSYGPIDAALMDELGANRLQFIRAGAITVEYSRDGGSTWTNYEASTTAKQQIFAQGGSLTIGKADSSNKATANPGKYKLRITIDTGAASVYSFLNKFVIYCSTNGSANCYCQIQIALQSTPTTFVNHTGNIPISGWSGYNIINTGGFTTYGNSSGSQYGRIRFIFGDGTGGSTSYNGLIIIQIKAFGGVGWTTPSTMAKTRHLYSYDDVLNASFPAQVTATRFNGAVKDVAADASTTFAYSKAGLGYGDFTWLAAWNGYELRAVNKDQFVHMASDTFPSIIPAAGNNWIKVGTSNDSYGLLPSKIGNAGSGHNYLGTSTWYWKYAYIDEIYGHLNGNITGSSTSCTGNAATATTASKLGSSTVGSATQPIYLNAGTATACTYTLGKSVPSNAVFTDHTYNFSGTSFVSGDSTTAYNCNNISTNSVLYYNSNGPSTSLGATSTDGALYSQAYSASWVGQIAQDYRNGSLFVRGKNNGTWQAWKRVIDSSSTSTITMTVPNSASVYITNGGTVGLHAQAGVFVQTETNFSVYAPVYASAFSVQSSIKTKENILDMSNEEAEKLYLLRPVKYDYKNKDNGINCYGLIAEEVLEANIMYPISHMVQQFDDEITGIHEGEDTIGLDYSKFIPYLIKVVQIQHKEIDELKLAIHNLQNVTIQTLQST